MIACLCPELLAETVGLSVAAGVVTGSFVPKGLVDFAGEGFLDNGPFVTIAGRDVCFPLVAIDGFDDASTEQ